MRSLLGLGYGAPDDTRFTINCLDVLGFRVRRIAFADYRHSLPVCKALFGRPFRRKGLYASDFSATVKNSNGDAKADTDNLSSFAMLGFPHTGRQRRPMYDKARGEALFGETMATLRAIAAPSEGILVSRRLEAVEGQRARELQTRLGASEPESVAWEEILQQLEREATPGPAFLLFIGLASVIAVSGLIAGSIPVLIGAMVVPPAITSLLAIAVGGLKGQWGLFRKGMSATMLTLVLSIVASWAVAGTLLGLEAITQDHSLLCAEIIQ